MNYLAALQVGALLLLTASRVTAGQWHYSLEYEPSYSSNIARTAENPQEEYVHALRFGIRYDDRSAVLEGSLNLDIEHLSYTNGTFADQNWSYLNADFTWALIRERLFWIVEDTLSNEPVASRQVWVPGNIQQTNVFTTGPRLDYRLDGGMHLLADLRYINSYAEITNEFDSNRWYLAAALAQDLSIQTEVSANLTWIDVDFDDRNADDYQRMDLFAAWDWQQGPSGLRIEIGGTRIAFDMAEGASGPLLRVTGNRQISSISRVAARLNHSYLDAAQRITRDTWTTPVSSNIISSQVYTVSEVELVYGTHWASGSAIEIVFNHQRQEYLEASYLDRSLTDTWLTWSKGFGSSVSLDAGVAYSRTVYDVDDRKDIIVSPFLGAHFQRNRRLSYRLGLYREERDSSSDAADYDELRVYAAIRYQH